MTAALYFNGAAWSRLLNLEQEYFEKRSEDPEWQEHVKDEERQLLQEQEISDAERLDRTQCFKRGRLHHEALSSAESVRLEEAAAASSNTQTPMAQWRYQCRDPWRAKAYGQVRRQGRMAGLLIWQLRARVYDKWAAEAQINFPGSIFNPFGDSEPPPLFNVEEEEEEETLAGIPLDVKLNVDQVLGGAAAPSLVDLIDTFLSDSEARQPLPNLDRRDFYELPMHHVKNVYEDRETAVRAILIKKRGTEQPWLTRGTENLDRYLARNFTDIYPLLVAAKVAIFAHPTIWKPAFPYTSSDITIQKSTKMDVYPFKTIRELACYGDSTAMIQYMCAMTNVIYELSRAPARSNIIAALCHYPNIPGVTAAWRELIAKEQLLALEPAPLPPVHGPPTSWASIHAYLTDRNYDPTILHVVRRKLTLVMVLELRSVLRLYYQLPMLLKADDLAHQLFYMSLPILDKVEAAPDIGLSVDLLDHMVMRDGSMLDFYPFRIFEGTAFSGLRAHNARDESRQLYWLSMGVPALAARTPEPEEWTRQVIHALVMEKPFESRYHFWASVCTTFAVQGITYSGILQHNLYMGYLFTMLGLGSQIYGAVLVGGLAASGINWLSTSSTTSRESQSWFRWLLLTMGMATFLPGLAEAVPYNASGVEMIPRLLTNDARTTNTPLVEIFSRAKGQFPGLIKVTTEEVYEAYDADQDMDPHMQMVFSREQEEFRDLDGFYKIGVPLVEGWLGQLWDSELNGRTWRDYKTADPAHFNALLRWSNAVTRQPLHLLNQFAKNADLRLQGNGTLVDKQVNPQDWQRIFRNQTYPYNGLEFFLSRFRNASLTDQTALDQSTTPVDPTPMSLDTFSNYVHDLPRNTTINPLVNATGCIRILQEIQKEADAAPPPDPSAIFDDTKKAGTAPKLPSGWTQEGGGVPTELRTLYHARTSLAATLDAFLLIKNVMGRLVDIVYKGKYDRVRDTRTYWSKEKDYAFGLIYQMFTAHILTRRYLTISALAAVPIAEILVNAGKYIGMDTMSWPVAYMISNLLYLMANYQIAKHEQRANNLLRRTYGEDKKTLPAPARHGMFKHIAGRAAQGMLAIYALLQLTNVVEPLKKIWLDPSTLNILWQVLGFFGNSLWQKVLIGRGIATDAAALIAPVNPAMGDMVWFVVKLVGFFILFGMAKWALPNRVAALAVNGTLDPATKRQLKGATDSLLVMVSNLLFQDSIGVTRNFGVIRDMFWEAAIDPAVRDKWSNAEVHHFEPGNKAAYAILLQHIETPKGDDAPIFVPETRPAAVLDAVLLEKTASPLFETWEMEEAWPELLLCESTQRGKNPMGLTFNDAIELLMQHGDFRDLLFIY